MRRGDVYLVDLEPTRGSEANKVRPAVIVSNDAANRAAERRGRGVVTVVPVTSNTKQVHPFQVLIAAGEGGLEVESKAQAEQLRAVSAERLRKRIGSLSPKTVDRIDGALRTHLAL
jgi:mRNA interferase MazF